jgi:hypothetical protein
VLGPSHIVVWTMLAVSFWWHYLGHHLLVHTSTAAAAEQKAALWQVAAMMEADMQRLSSWKQTLQQRSQAAVAVIAGDPRSVGAGRQQKSQGSSKSQSRSSRKGGVVPLVSTPSPLHCGHVPGCFLLRQVR